MHCDLQRQEKCKVHQLNMGAFVSSAQSWDVGIFKWVNNVVRLYPFAVYKSLNACLQAFQRCQLISSLKTILPSLNFFYFFYIRCNFSLRGIKPPFLAKKIYALALIFLSSRITPLVSAEARFGCRNSAGSRNSNLIPSEAGLILSLLVCVMQGQIGTSTLP